MDSVQDQEQLVGFLPFSSLNLEQQSLIPIYPSSVSLPLLEYFPSSQSLSPNFDVFVAPKVPKPEPFESDQWIYQLPDLRSLEDHRSSPISASTKRFRSTSSFPPPSTFGAVIRNRNRLPYNSSPSPPAGSSKTAAAATNEAARKRRKTISEKTRSLAKLMPWEKKMDIATMLSEAHKYIKFLQAQVSVLQSMPYHSLLPPTNSSVINGGGGSGSGSGSGRFAVLEKLNRQQLLQVVVNSPVAQTVLCSQESCVYSLEQVLLLKNGLMDLWSSPLMAPHP